MNSRVKLGLDGRIFSQAVNGVSRYTAALLASLRHRDMYEIVLFSDTLLREEYNGIIQGLSVVYSSGSDRKKWRTQILPRQLKENGIQLFHATWDKGVPFGSPCPVVMTIHDLFCISAKNNHLSFLKKFKRRLDLRREVGACHKIFTVSQFTKDSIIRDLGVPAQQIVVTPLDCDRKRIDAVLSRPVDRVHFEAKTGVGDYFFSPVGRLSDKRKNIPFLLRSYIKFFKRDVAHKRFRLLIAGQYQPQDEAYQDLMRLVTKEGLEGQVLFPGHLSDEDFYWMLKRSKAMVFTSLFEGFGIPLVEAFYAGVPVIAGKTSAMAEIAAEGAAMLVDPQDEGALAEAMHQVVSSLGVADRLIEQGSLRSRAFDWERSVDEIVRTYEGVLNEERL